MLDVSRTERTGLVLECVEALSPLGDLGDVLAHDSDRVVNLRLDGCRLGSSSGGRARRVLCKTARAAQPPRGQSLVE